MNKNILILMVLLAFSGCNNTATNNAPTTSKKVIIDGLTYENIPLTKEYNWNDANKHCTKKGWRLPTRGELSKVANIALYQIDDNNEKWFEDHKKWYVENKSKQNSDNFVKKVFAKNMANDWRVIWTSEKDNSMPEGDYHYTINFHEGHIATNEGHLPNGVLCVK